MAVSDMCPVCNRYWNMCICKDIVKTIYRENDNMNCSKKIRELNENIDILKLCMKQNYEIQYNEIMKKVEGVAREAARLRYEEPEQYREYLHAKKEAAKRLRVKTYPSNKWVYKFYQELADLYEGGHNRKQQLKEMREEALWWMELLEEYKPRVIGSVQRGDVTKKSDIDLHVFVEDDEEEICEFLQEQGIEFDCDMGTVRCGNEQVDYYHVYVKKKYNCEISVYKKRYQQKQVCSIFCVPIKGLTIAQLKKKIN